MSATNIINAAKLILFIAAATWVWYWIQYGDRFFP